MSQLGPNTESWSFRRKASQPFFSPSLKVHCTAVLHVSPHSAKLQNTESTDCWQPAQAWAGACRNWFASWSPVLPHHFACKQALVASKASSSSKKPAWNHLSSLAVNLPSNCSSMERRKLRFVPIPSGLYLSAIPGIPFLWELSKGCHRVSLSISFEGCKFRLQHRLVFNARTPSLVTGLPGPWRPHCWMHFDSCKKVFWTHRKGEHYRFELWRFSHFFAV